MKVFRLFLVPALWASFAAPALAEIIPLSQLSGYLNAISTAQGDFTQLNGDGSISTGTIYIQRPGRARFEYNPPDYALVMAGGGQVAIFDDKSNVGPEQYPLRRTPLSLILAADVNLERANMVVGHREDGATTIVTAQDPENPEYGNIQLVFTGDPVELRQWIITDDAGGQTTLILGQLERGVQLSSRLFSIPLEVQSRQRD